MAHRAEALRPTGEPGQQADASRPIGSPRHIAGSSRPIGDRRQKTGGGASAPQPVPAALTAAARPRLPADLSQLWLVPVPAASPASKPLAGFAAAARLFTQAKYSEALTLFSAPSLAGTPLAGYAALYRGLCLANLARPAEARAAFTGLRALPLKGFLAEAAVGREAEAASAQGDHVEAARLYEELARSKTAAPDSVLMAVGKEHLAAGDRVRAHQAFSRVYYEFPLSGLSELAAVELDGLEDLRPAKGSAARTLADLGRAERLFAAKRYQPARQAFEAIESAVTGDDAELTAIRLAECDDFLRHYRAGPRAPRAAARPCVPQGRSAVLLPDRHARTGGARGICPSDSGVRHGLP